MEYTHRDQDEVSDLMNYFSPRSSAIEQLSKGFLQQLYLKNRNCSEVKINLIPRSGSLVPYKHEIRLQSLLREAADTNNEQ